MCKDKPRVLFVDDDQDILDMCQITAEHLGWFVQTASTGEEMLQRVNEVCAEGGECFDIIVTDVQFFGGSTIRMTGMAAGREVRDKYPNLPILFLTGYGGQLTRENVRELGNAALMVKPVELSALMARIRGLIDRTPYYQGEERRGSALNRSGHQRRSTDRLLEVPEVLSRAMNSIRRSD